MKKLLLSLGTIASIAVPVIAVVSCGNQVVGGVSYNDKEITFNLNTSDSNGPFAAGNYGKDIKEGLTLAVIKKLQSDIEGAMAADNALIQPTDGSVTFTVKLTGNANVATWVPFANGTEGHVAVNGQNFSQEIKFVLKDAPASTTTDLGTGTYGFKNNVVTSVLQALSKNGYLQESPDGTTAPSQTVFTTVNEILAFFTKANSNDKAVITLLGDSKGNFDSDSAQLVDEAGTPIVDVTIGKTTTQKQIDGFIKAHPGSRVELKAATTAPVPAHVGHSALATAISAASADRSLKVIDITKNTL